jgi:hypothetical protein
MAFDYSTSGLPSNPKWEAAAQICNQWLNENMKMFGPERIVNFMHNQPVAAAKRVIDNCPDYTEESVTLLLLGPAKGILAANPETETVCRRMFGDRAVDLLLTMAGNAPVDEVMSRDVGRIFIAEGVSTMTDQMIGRAKIDKFHQRRWDILNDLEATFSTVKGVDPALDKVFEDAAQKSRDALETLDKAAAAQPKKPSGPRPPFGGGGHGGHGH